jgi:hypothetical protein
LHVFFCIVGQNALYQSIHHAPETDCGSTSKSKFS